MKMQNKFSLKEKVTHLLLKHLKDIHLLNTINSQDRQIIILLNQNETYQNKLSEYLDSCDLES